MYLAKLTHLINQENNAIWSPGLCVGLIWYSPLREAYIATEKRGIITELCRVNISITYYTKSIKTKWEKKCICYTGYKHSDINKSSLVCFYYEGFKC